jgi:hypothetical protein
VLRYERPYVAIAQCFSKASTIITFVESNRDALVCFQAVDHHQRSFSFGGAAGLSSLRKRLSDRFDFHQCVGEITKYGRRIFTFAVQPRLGIRRRSVCVVAARLSLKVDVGVTAAGRRPIVGSWLKTLVTRLRFQQRSVDRKMLVAYEIGCSSDVDHGGKKLLTYRFEETYDHDTRECPRFQGGFADFFTGLLALSLRVGPRRAMAPAL